VSTWNADRTPIPPHPFAHSVAGDDWVLISGVGGHAPDGSIAEDAAEQARAAVRALEFRLKRAGSSLAEIVWFRPVVSAREHLLPMNNVIDELLPYPRAAGGALLICELADPRMKVEFEVWARRGVVLSESG
jgi:enamine deaminase RidA (YjgF/YER057c/UK114 family)